MLRDGGGYNLWELIKRAEHVRSSMMDSSVNMPAHIGALTLNFLDDAIDSMRRIHYSLSEPGISEQPAPTYTPQPPSKGEA